MKASRNILRKVELKIYQAITMEQIKKNSMTGTQQKLDWEKSSGENAAK